MAKGSTYQLAPTQAYQAPDTVGLDSVKQPSYAEWVQATNAGNAFQWQQNQKNESNSGFGAMLPMALLGLAAPYAVKFINKFNQAQQAQQFINGLQDLKNTVRPYYRQGKQWVRNLFRNTTTQTNTPPGAQK